MEREVPQRNPRSQDIGSLLKAVGLSRDAAASLLGISRDSVNNWCSGRTSISPRNLGRLAQILRESGTPRDILHNLLTTYLMDWGIAVDIIDLLGDNNFKGTEPGPIIVLGSQFYSGSHQLMLSGIHDAMRVAGNGEVVYLDTCGSMQVLDYYTAVALRSSLKGVVFIGFDPSERQVYEMLTELVSHSIPCVFLGSGPAVPPVGTAVVQLDGYRAAAFATETLWAKGHRDITALAVDRKVPQIRKVQGYSDTIERLGGRNRVVWTLLPDAGSQPAAADRPDLHEAAEMIVSDLDASAVLALSSHAAKSAMSALRKIDRGPTTPRVSLMALGCWDWMHLVSFPPITHVVLPFYEAGQRAAAMLLALRADDFEPHQREVTVPLPDYALHESTDGTLFDINTVRVDA